MENQQNELCPIAVNDQLGRHLVTARHIKPGEQLLSERPLVIGPHTDSGPVCLNCWVSLSPFPFTKCCPRCRIAPLCAACATRQPPDAIEFNENSAAEQGCYNARIVHDLRECDAYMNSKLDHRTLLQNMQIVMPLRCLMLDKTEFQILLQMESHTSKRRDSPIWKAHQSSIVDLVYQLELARPDVGDASGPETLQHVCGVLDVNTFELRAPCGSASTGRGLYPRAALLSHDCVATAHVTLDTDYRMRVYAAAEIPHHRPVYFNYTNVMHPTWKRREHLREGKYFDCVCERCRDATELGTHLSSVLCFACKVGQLISTAPLSAEPWTSDNLWRCQACAESFPATAVKDVLDKITADIQDIDKSDERALESVLKNISRTLTPTHYLIVDLKQALAGVLRDIIAREVNPAKRYLQRKLDICREMHDLLSVVEPGLSRLRGIALYEIYVCITQLANREYDSQDITAPELLLRLREAERCLRSAVSLLLYEPGNTPEGHLTKRAFDELRSLRDTIMGAEGLVERDAKKTRNKRRHNNQKL